MTAEDYADALKATCGLPGCARPPGEPCVNSVTGDGPRSEPHWNRVARGRGFATGGIVTGPIRLPSAGCVIEPAGDTLSTSARLAKAEQLLAAVDAQLITTLRERDEARAAGYAASTALASARSDLARLEEHQELRARVVRERNTERALLRAELASARQEIAQLRAALAKADQERDELVAEAIDNAEADLPLPDNQNGAPMTPEEHYAYGRRLLKGCERLFEVDHGAAASQAVIAQAHFAAAAAGTGIRAMQAMTQSGEPS